MKNLDNYYLTRQDFICEEMWKLVDENSKGLLDHLEPGRRVQEITRLRNAFMRAGYLNKEDICKDEFVNTKRNLGGKLAKAVVANIKGNYDENQYYKERLVVLDREITRLTNERDLILERLNGGQ